MEQLSMDELLDSAKIKLDNAHYTHLETLERIKEVPDPAVRFATLISASVTYQAKLSAIKAELASQAAVSLIAKA